MYADLAEHVNLLMAIMGLFGTAVIVLIWKFLVDLRSDVKSLTNKFEAFLMNVVTRPECDQKHESLITLFTTMMNCRTCGRKDEVQR